MSEAVKKTSATKENMVTIKIPRAAVGEDNMMIVTLNGKGYKIKRGVTVDVPEAIAEIVEKSLAARDRADDYIEEIRQKD